MYLWIDMSFCFSFVYLLHYFLLGHFFSFRFRLYTCLLYFKICSLVASSCHQIVYSSFQKGKQVSTLLQVQDAVFPDFIFQIPYLRKECITFERSFLTCVQLDANKLKNILSNYQKSKTKICKNNHKKIKGHNTKRLRQTHNYLKITFLGGK